MDNSWIILSLNVFVIATKTLFRVRYASQINKFFGTRFWILSRSWSLSLSKMYNTMNLRHLMHSSRFVIVMGGSNIGKSIKNEKQYYREINMIYKTHFSCRKTNRHTWSDHEKFVNLVSSCSLSKNSMKIKHDADFMQRIRINLSEFINISIINFSWTETSSFSTRLGF